MKSMNLGEIARNLEGIKDWALEGVCLCKTFEFNTFKEAISFTNKVADIAEKHNHHPDITITYNRVSISLTTHSASSVTQKDFDVAKEIEKAS